MEGEGNIQWAGADPMVCKRIDRKIGLWQEEALGYGRDCRG